MNLLDAYALVAFLIGGPAASRVRAALREGGAAVATANLAEALDVAQRVHGLPIERAMELLDPLLESAITAVPLDVALARRAAEIRAVRYHRTSRPISLADAILLASTRSGDRLYTADPDLVAVAAQEGIEAVVLPGQG